VNRKQSETRRLMI